MIDLQTGKESATQVDSLLLTASLSTSVNAVKRLTREEMVECLVSPLRDRSDFLTAFDELKKVAWYLPHTPEERYYFDRQENLTKLPQSLAHDAPPNKVDDLIRNRLKEMFKATRKTCYEDVLPLPKLEEVAEQVRRGRVLLIVNPDSKIPPEEVQKFLDAPSQKLRLHCRASSRFIQILNFAKRLLGLLVADCRQIPKEYWLKKFAEMDRGHRDYHRPPLLLTFHWQGGY